jgi:hypothetical protein
MDWEKLEHEVLGHRGRIMHLYHSYPGNSFEVLMGLIGINHVVAGHLRDLIDIETVMRTGRSLTGHPVSRQGERGPRQKYIDELHEFIRAVREGFQDIELIISRLLRGLRHVGELLAIIDLAQGRMLNQSRRGIFPHYIWPRGSDPSRLLEHAKSPKQRKALSTWAEISAGDDELGEMVLTSAVSFAWKDGDSTIRFVDPLEEIIQYGQALRRLHLPTGALLAERDRRAKAGEELVDWVAHTALQGLPVDNLRGRLYTLKLKRLMKAAFDTVLTEAKYGLSTFSFTNSVGQEVYASGRMTKSLMLEPMFLFASGKEAAAMAREVGQHQGSGATKAPLSWGTSNYIVRVDDKMVLNSGMFPAADPEWWKVLLAMEQLRTWLKRGEEPEDYVCPLAGWQVFLGNNTPLPCKDTCIIRGLFRSCVVA